MSGEGKAAEGLLVEDFDFELPAELIAQEPPEVRGRSRMLAMDRAAGTLRDVSFAEFPSLLNPGDLLVLNDSRVIPARLYARRTSVRDGREPTGQIEVLLTEPAGDFCWRALVKPGKKVGVGERLVFPSPSGAIELEAEVLERGEFGERLLRFAPADDFFAAVDRIGHMPLPPYIKRDETAKIDFIGFGLLAVWLATLQVILDKGQEADWFNAHWICWFTTTSVLSFVGFVAWEFHCEHPLVDLRVFKNRNFTVGVILMGSLGAILYGTTAQLPLFLQTLMGYPALQSGYAMSPRGIAAFITTLFVGRLVGKIPMRWMLAFGFSTLAFSSFMLSGLNLQVSQIDVIWPSIINGIAISFIFVPLTTTTMSQLSQQQIGNASGLYNLVRNLGGSVGIAYVTTMLARGAQVHQALMVGHLTPTDPAFASRLAATQHIFAQTHDPGTARTMAYASIYNTLDQQAHLWAFVDVFMLFGCIALGAIPMVLLFKKVKLPAKPVPGAGH